MAIRKLCQWLNVPLEDMHDTARNMKEELKKSSTIDTGRSIELFESTKEKLNGFMTEQIELSELVIINFLLNPCQSSHQMVRMMARKVDIDDI